MKRKTGTSEYSQPDPCFRARGQADFVDRFLELQRQGGGRNCPQGPGLRNHTASTVGFNTDRFYRSVV